MIRALLPPVLLLVACGEEARTPDAGGSTTPRYERVLNESSLLPEASVPVRVGEYGQNFAACTARGTLRSPAADAALTVRAAPYEAAVQADRLGPGSSFFVCSRSLDQKWFGIVYASGGVADASCGVSAPVPARRDYAGSCRSGWVASAFVKLAGPS